MAVARLSGLRAFDEILCAFSRALIGSQHTRGRINLFADDAVGLRETVAAEFGPERERLLHKRCPDGQRRLRAFEAKFGVIVKADPNDADQIWRVAGEPTVARGAGLARRHGAEAHRASARRRA